MTEHHQALLNQLGFRFGINGAHAARTMMLEDLRLLLAETPPQATTADYALAVIDGNVLGKPTRKSRELALRHMVSLYGLDPANSIFRALRRLWPIERAAQPLLALAAALARDPLLFPTQGLVLNMPVGATLPREAVEAFIKAKNPDRFSAASLRSFAQNVAGTWTAAGFLHGKVRKSRAAVPLHPESITMLLFLGYLEGRTGQRLFSSNWVKLSGAAPEEAESLATSAANKGLLVFMNAGGVKEVRFPGYLTSDEDKIRQEVAHVV